MTDSMSDSVTESMDIDDSFKLSMIMRAPSHHVGLCMLDSPTVSLEKVLKKSATELTDDDKSLAACIASPCEAAEDCRIVEGIRKNVYMVAEDTNNAEILRRLRKLRKKRRTSQML